jgi:exonuclease VII small subunit
VKIENLRQQLQYLVNLKASGDGRLGIDEAILNLEQSIQNLDPAQKHLQDLNAAVDQLLYGKADKVAELNEQLSILQERLSSGAISEGQFDQAAKSIYGNWTS